MPGKSTSSLAALCISSSTFSAAGRAGSVAVDAATILVDGATSEISASAHRGTRGQTGGVTVSARESLTLSNGGALSIRNEATVANPGTVQPTLLSVSAGGNVLIDVHALVPNGNSLSVGGSEQLVFQPGVFGFNVIQAASRTGVSGTIEVTAPQLDIAGSLRGLSADVVNLGALPRDLCRVGANSSLTPLGRGGLRPTSSGMIRPDVAISTDSEDRLAGMSVVGDANSGREPTTLTGALDCRY